LLQKEVNSFLTDYIETQKAGGEAANGGGLPDEVFEDDDDDDEDESEPDEKRSKADIWGLDLLTVAEKLNVHELFWRLEINYCAI